MSRRFFAQSLADEKILGQEDILPLLEEAGKILSLHQGEEAHAEALAEVLVKNNVLTKEKAEELFNGMSGDCLYDKALAVLGDETFARYTEIFCISLQKLVFADCVIVDSVTEATPYFVFQAVHGDINVATAVGAPDTPFLRLASSFSGEELDEIDDLAIDCWAEFLNVVNGLYMVELASKNIHVELDPPDYFNRLPKLKDAHVVNLLTTYGELRLYLSPTAYIL